MPAIKPFKTYSDISNQILFTKDLGKIGGVYGIVNKEFSLQGYSLNLYSRLLDHKQRF